MSDDHRALELEVEVPGTVEEVWRAIATGPGISSWYVPHTVEEREGGAASATFGPDPEMTVPGRVAVWEPPHRVVFDGGEGVEGLAFEWVVEAHDGGTCVVRLVNSGFGTGAEWDDQYDGMEAGWRLFLTNLRLHLEHFSGRTALSMLPTATWPGPRRDTWTRLTGDLGIPAGVEPGDRVELTPADGPSMAGTVADTESWRIALLLDRPAPGTAFLAAEGGGDHVEVSVWTYLYGEDAGAITARDLPRWTAWLASRAVET